MWRRFLLQWFTTIGMIVVLSGMALAQTFPSKTIRIIVPYAPGGAIDLTARLIGQQLQDRLRQTVIVDNRPGANAAIGIEALIRSSADGHTIAVVSDSPLTITPHLSHVNYDPLKDVTPVVRAVFSPQILAVNAKLPIKSLADLIVYDQNNPGKVSYSVSARGSAGHLTGELLKKKTGLTMQAVPYRGGAPAAVAIASGEVTAGIVDTTSVLPLIEGGQVRPLAVTEKQRLETLPDIPTVTESGVPDFSASASLVVIAPGGTPAAIVTQLNAEITKVLAEPDVRKKLLAAHLSPAPTSAEETARNLRDDSQRWERLIKDIGLSIK